MDQTLHIFGKDTHRLWREISVAMLLLVVYTWSAPERWRGGQEMMAFGPTPILILLVPVALCIAWAYLMIRVVQEERLVGDKQFWVTRPYRWGSLMAAKALFLVAFVHLPLLIAGFVLMLRSGLHPMPHLPAILFQQLLLATVFTLPVIMLASVTAKVTNLLLWLLGLILAAVLVGFLANLLDPESPPMSLQWVQAMECFSVLLCAALAVLFCQYRRRATLVSRSIVGVTVILLTCSALLTPQGLLISRFYPAEPQNSQFQLAFDAEALATRSDSGEPMVSRGKVIVSIPIRLTGLASQQTLALDGQQVEIETAAHQRWNSGWQSQGSYLSNSEGSDRMHIDVAMPERFFRTAERGPVTIRLSTLLSRLEPVQVMTLALPSKPFRVPEVGVCEFSDLSNNIECLSPVTAPHRWVVSTDWSGSPCRQSAERRPERPMSAHEWRQRFNPLPGPDIVPVDVTNVSLGAAGDSQRRSATLCVGTNVTFAIQRTAERLSQSMVVPNVSLRELELTPLAISSLDPR